MQLLRWHWSVTPPGEEFIKSVDSIHDAVPGMRIYVISWISYQGDGFHDAMSWMPWRHPGTPSAMEYGIPLRSLLARLLRTREGRYFSRRDDPDLFENEPC